MISPEAKIYRCSIEFKPTETETVNDSQPSLASDNNSSIEQNFQTTVHGSFLPIKPKQVQFPTNRRRVVKLPS